MSARAKALFVVVTMLFYSLGAPLATALEAQIGPTNYDIAFEPNLPDGYTYVLTINGVDHQVTAVTGDDLTISYPAGTVLNYTFADYAYSGESTRRGKVVQSSSPHTVIADLRLVCEYIDFDLYKITFDQTGLLDGTAYFIDFMGDAQALFISGIDMLAGTPHTEWMAAGAPLNPYYDEIAYNHLGAYYLIDTLGFEPFLPTAAGAGSQGYVGGITGPADIVGVYASAYISGTVFYDYNNNGVQDPGEPGIPGATVELFGAFQQVEQPNGAFSSASIPDGLSSLLTTITNSVGTYSFNNLPAGTFYIRVTLPDGSQSDSVAIVLAAAGDTINSGQADFPRFAELPYTGR
jgi:hypothetical protein